MVLRPEANRVGFTGCSSYPRILVRALALAKEGTSLCLLDIDQAGLSRVAEAAAGFKVDVITTVCDLSDPKQITASARSLLAARTSVNILINSAGVIHYGPMVWNRIIAVNLSRAYSNGSRAVRDARGARRRQR